MADSSSTQAAMQSAGMTPSSASATTGVMMGRMH
jgi:hypothetical protein